ncbi:MAG: PQQ-dependent sugar dehydrogenase, partial [Verrucomicrobiota bacterium]
MRSSVSHLSPLCLLLTLAAAAEYPNTYEYTRDGVTVWLEDYAAVPLSSRTSGTYPPPQNFSDQLSRPNFLRAEPVDAPLAAERFFVCDLNRELYILHRSSRSFTPYLNFEELFAKFINSSGYAGGLIAFAFDPGYADNGRFYTVHSEDPGKAGSTAPSPAVLPGLDLSAGYTATAPLNPPMGGVGRQSVLIEWTDTDITNDTFEGTARELLRIGFHTRIHPIGDIAFNPNARPGDADYGNLYLAVGDGAAGESDSPDMRRRLPQRLDAVHGKILRFTPDLDLRPDDELAANGRYRIPTTGPAPNPFLSAQLDGLQKEIFALGFRNPHRLSWDAESDLFLAFDIGLDAWEEVNVLRAGANYGYPEREGVEQLFIGGTRHRQTGGQLNPPVPFPSVDLLDVEGWPDAMAPVYPAVTYSHRDGDAIAGGFIYRGTRMPSLQGHLIFGDVTNDRILRVSLDDL